VRGRDHQARQRSGAAVGASFADAFQKALDADAQSAFGGIIAWVANSRGTGVAHRGGTQADVIIAASIQPDAIDILVKRRKATRLLSAPSPEPLGRSVRTFGNTALVQNADELLVPVSDWKCVTFATPTISSSRTSRLRGACVRERRRRDSDRARRRRGRHRRRSTVARRVGGHRDDQGQRVRPGRAAASDAFFPFADGLESLTSAGVTSVVQPGGSVRDQEVIDAANAAGIVMMLTGERHFRH